MYKLLAGAIGVSLLVTGVGWFSYEAGADGVRSDMAEVVKEAVKKAREDERLKQEKVNELTQTQYDELADINKRLNNDIDRLRNRASRRHLPNESKAKCKGATGAELSKEDGRFLVWEAARADKLRAAIKACYSYADTIK